MDTCSISDDRPTNPNLLLGFAGIVFLQVMLLGWSAVIHSPTTDETAHLAAGLRCITTARFDLYSVNPPLVKCAAAVPVLILGYSHDWSRIEESSYRPEWGVGRDFIEANGSRIFLLVTVARLGCIPFVVCGTWVSFSWARRLYGVSSGLAAAALWAFSPAIMGHGSLITPDVPAGALSLLAIYRFWIWRRVPCLSNAGIAGAALGLALLSKHTTLLLIAVIPAVELFDTLFTRKRGIQKRWFGVAVILLAAIMILNCGYMFRGSFARLDGYRFFSTALAGGNTHVTGTGNRFSDSVAGKLPVPFPRDYLMGLDLQKRDLEKGKWAYLYGSYSKRGWWYYYLYAAMVKCPGGTLALICLALLRGIFRPVRFLKSDEFRFLVLPALVYLAAVSAGTGINRHFRYIIPATPFLFVWISGLAGAEAGRQGRLVASGLVLCSALSSLSIYPHSLSYFNELCGGPSNGHHFLLHSNIDWGQDLLLLREWLDAHPKVRLARVACDGPVPPDLAGIETTRTEHTSRCEVDRNCLQPSLWYAISINEMMRPGSPNRRFAGIVPDERIGFSICLFRVDRGRP